MNYRLMLSISLLLWSLSVIARGSEPQGLLRRTAGSHTVVGYHDTPLLPATNGHYHVHDPDRPLPPYVDPGPERSGLGFVAAPADALVLVAGNDLSQWEATDWKTGDGWVAAGEGALQTKASFGDCQLHLEWMAPDRPDTLMNRGNSGVLLMGLYEIQVFDSHPMHDEQIYADGQAASVYGQTPPLVNACRQPGQWQSYDILFSAPVFAGDQLRKPARVTVHHNGVLVHRDQPIMGPMAHRVLLPYRPHAERLPLSLQGHHSQVRYRNIWIRRL